MKKLLTVAFMVPLLFLTVPTSASSLDRDLQEVLLEAAEKGATAIVTSVLSMGADMDAALVTAAASGNDDAVKLLLKQGADPNAKDGSGVRALQYAAARDLATTVKVLLDGGADVNAADNSGRTALMEAAGEDMPHIAQMLIAKGATVDAKDQSGNTAWWYAAESGFQVAAILKDAGAKEAFDTLRWSGQYSEVLKARTMSITSRSAWRAFWTRFFPEAFETAVPDMDFTRYFAVCVFLGTRPTEGYGIEFDTPYQEGRKMVIPFREVKPAGSVTQGNTQPYAIKVFKKENDLSAVIKKEKTNRPR
jgi:hypothetical protein